MEKGTDLSNKKCIPCEGGVDALNKNQASKLLTKLDKKWILADNHKSPKAPTLEFVGTMKAYLEFAPISTACLIYL